MKKIILTPLLITVFGLSGCSEGPEDVAIKMNEVLCSSGKISALKAFVTPASIKTIDMMSAMMDDPKKGQIFQGQVHAMCKSTRSIESEDVDGDMAMVFYKSGNAQEFEKINGEWKAVILK